MSLRSTFEWLTALVVLTPLVAVTITVVAALTAVLLVLIGLISPIIALWMVIVLLIEYQVDQENKEKLAEVVNSTWTDS